MIPSYEDVRFVAGNDPAVPNTSPDALFLDQAGFPNGRAIRRFLDSIRAIVMPLMRAAPALAETTVRRFPEIPIYAMRTKLEDCSACRARLENRMEVPNSSSIIGERLKLRELIGMVITIPPEIIEGADPQSNPELKSRIAHEYRHHITEDGLCASACASEIVVNSWQKSDGDFGAEFEQSMHPEFDPQKFFGSSGTFLPDFASIPYDDPESSAFTDAVYIAAAHGFYNQSIAQIIEICEGLNALAIREQLTPPSSEFFNAIRAVLGDKIGKAVLQRIAFRSLTSGSQYYIFPHKQRIMLSSTFTATPDPSFGEIIAGKPYQNAFTFSPATFQGNIRIRLPTGYFAEWQQPINGLRGFDIQTFERTLRERGTQDSEISSMNLSIGRMSFEVPARIENTAAAHASGKRKPHGKKQRRRRR